MANDFRFEELGPRAFEQLCVALAMAAFGPRVEAYGSGRDGGREATSRGRLAWSSDENGEAWDGYTIFQAKHREHVASTADNLRWLKRHIRAELDSWADPASQRGELPNNLLFITNARLAPAPGNGIDELARYIDEQLSRLRLPKNALELHGPGWHSRSSSAETVLVRVSEKDTLKSRGLRNVKVWHRDTLNGRISIDQSIRMAFPSLWTVGDAFAMTQTVAVPKSSSHEALAELLRDHAQAALRHERWIRFEEAGATSRGAVDQAITDLPVFIGADREKSVINHCLTKGDQVFRLSTWNSPNPRHLVITGAPGNGKSTLTRYLTQIYRCEFAQHEENEPAVTQIIDDTTHSLGRLGLKRPNSTRWPIRIDLAEAVVEMAKSPHINLKKLICEQLNSRGNSKIDPYTLERWLATWPSLLIFDGLDEISSQVMRSEIIDEVIALVERLDSNNSDAFVMVTTRPTGYTEKIAPKYFGQIDLAYFNLAEAATYGRHITAQRYHDDDQQRDRVLARFDAAIKDETTERLLKTPLQVLILTVILASAGSLPANRYLLFWRYYETVFRREVDKPTGYQQFLSDHQSDILELHQQVGLVLQIECEASGDLRGRLPRASLGSLALHRMLSVGHDHGDAKRLAAKILDVAMQRLVLLVADQDHTVSFDVRSLQELMAARAIVNGPEADIRGDLTTIAASPHWRNTWLLAAGALFAESSFKADLMLDVVEHCDAEGGWPEWLYPVAPELAAYILDDGLASANPKATRRLIDSAMRCLSGPMPEEPEMLARGLTAAVFAQKVNLVHIRNSLKGAFAGSREQRAIAASICSFGEFGSRVPGQPADLKRFVDMWRIDPTEKGQKVRVKRILKQSIAELSEYAPVDDLHMIESALSDCDSMTLVRTSQGDYWPVKHSKAPTSSRLRDIVENRVLAELLELCLGDLDPEMWAARSMVVRSIWPLYARAPVSQKLSDRLLAIHRSVDHA
jgi:hypothetical protein